MKNAKMTKLNGQTMFTLRQIKMSFFVSNQKLPQQIWQKSFVSYHRQCVTSQGFDDIAISADMIRPGPSVNSKVHRTLIKHSKCPKPVLLTAKNHEKFINSETEAVIFVREPLERLLAGYRMMFNHPNVTKHNYDLFIRPILNKVRFEGKSVMPKSPVEAWEKAGFHRHASRLSS